MEYWQLQIAPVAIYLAITNVELPAATASQTRVTDSIMTGRDSRDKGQLEFSTPPTVTQQISWRTSVSDVDLWSPVSDSNLPYDYDRQIVAETPVYKLLQLTHGLQSIHNAATSNVPIQSFHSQRPTVLPSILENMPINHHSDNSSVL
jgi:hypothetical protein